VIEQHNTIFIYGDVERARETLLAKGFREEVVETPVPHVHHYQEALDGEFESLMRMLDWDRSDLRDREGD